MKVSVSILSSSIKAADITKKLDYYESKLNLYNNKKKIEKLIKNIDSNIKEQIEELI